MHPIIMHYWYRPDLIEHFNKELCTQHEQILRIILFRVFNEILKDMLIQCVFHAFTNAFKLGSIYL